jgi:PTS system fructose-specific IIC component
MANKESFFGDVRKHLMTGVSYMIPFVVPGGILIAVAFAMGGIYVFNTPGFAADMFGWGKVAFGLMVPALAGFIAYSIADRPVSPWAPWLVCWPITRDRASWAA